PGRDRLPAGAGAVRRQPHHLRRRVAGRGGRGARRRAADPPRPLRAARGQRAVRQRQDPDQAGAARDRRRRGAGERAVRRGRVRARPGAALRRDRRRPPQPLFRLRHAPAAGAALDAAVRRRGDARVPRLGHRRGAVVSVFRGYDQEQLDALYDTRRMVPDWQTYTDRFEARSAALRARMPDALALAYGPHPRERLDLFLPGGVERPPLQAFFHGGYWRSGEKERYSYIAEAFLDAGAAAAIVEYALVPGVDMDELVRQCRAAVSWLAAAADRLGFDGERIHVSGHSAGGHIVAMLMADGWEGAGIVKSGLGLSGLYELEPIRLSYLNETLGLDPAAAARNSPALLTPAG